MKKVELKVYDNEGLVDTTVVSVEEYNKEFKKTQQERSDGNYMDSDRDVAISNFFVGYDTTNYSFDRIFLKA